MIDIQYSDEVRTARATGQPIVALESTIITHGMPYPQNVEVAKQVENDIRQSGGTPATIAVLQGRLCVGLNSDQLVRLGQSGNVAKLSRADLAACLATGGTGATTVAATMIAAHRAGIDVFATGGIGGVHRGAEDSFDISADLRELAETPVSVVAAGAKAILDIPKTLEVLETLGVPVIAVDKMIFRPSGLRRRPCALRCAWMTPKQLPVRTTCAGNWDSPAVNSLPIRSRNRMKLRRKSCYPSLKRRRLKPTGLA